MAKNFVNNDNSDNLSASIYLFVMILLAISGIKSFIKSNEIFLNILFCFFLFFSVSIRNYNIIIFLSIKICCIILHEFCQRIVNIYKKVTKISF